MGFEQAGSAGANTTWRLSLAKSSELTKLSGARWRQLQEALKLAFPTYADLTRLVKFHLDENLNNIVGPNVGMDTVLFEVIQWAQARGWIERLFLAAREERPDSPLLVAFGIEARGPQVGAGAKPIEDSGLERLLRADVPAVKLRDLLEKLGAIEGRVCRIEIDRRVRGTGFLVGPSCVMTNYHVMKPVIDGVKRPDSVVCRFDYRDGFQGTPFTLDLDWNVHFSPYAEFEKTRLDDGIPREDELDYAVVRLADAPGHKALSDKASEKALLRDIVPIPEGALALTKDAPLIVVQHPVGRTLEIAIETHGVIDYNANGTRLKHRVNTDEGSSGSPVFDFKGTLVALHHGGDNAELPVFNQAIPIDAIRRDLERAGKIDALKD